MTANYINFLAYNVLIRNLKTEEGHLLKVRTNTYFFVMNGLYVLNFLLSFTEFYGPYCKSN